MANRPEPDEIDVALSQAMCPRCLTKLKPIEVHGHYQCSTCKLYISECCGGERADNCLCKIKRDASKLQTQV
jgi:hypothetical protein